MWIYTVWYEYCTISFNLAGLNGPAKILVSAGCQKHHAS